MGKSGAAALLLDPGSDAAARAWLQHDLLPRLGDRDFALIVKDQTELVTTIGADGIHLSDAAALKKLRGKFADLSIGVSCPLERHDAMIAAELGADYVAFEPTDADEALVQPLIQWWSEMMTVPSVVFAATPERAQAAVQAGADFIAAPATVWLAADPLAEVRRFAQCLG
ncbi:MAG TPA: thiamine phosphate synthase [Dongiaceae bacterium]|nr:thiamine phosphate synthase [Dongiaceae bacterium]